MRGVLPPRLGLSAIGRYQSANPSLGVTSTMVLKAGQKQSGRNPDGARSLRIKFT
jgi:hypothetical protein